jgi:hypothetical protein
MTAMTGIAGNGTGSAGRQGPDHDGGNSPLEGEGASGGRPARVPLRELVDGRLLDELLERSRDEAGGLRLTGEGSVLGEMVAAVLERALQGELAAHLGYGKHDAAGNGSGNSRNGYIAKTVQTGVGPVPVQVPRDRNGTFEPLLIPKRSGRIAGGLDDMVVSLYAHGMSVRDIVHHLEQVYGTRLSHDTVSRITDGVLEEVRAWQPRPLDPVYPVVFLDALVVKVCDNAAVQKKPAYLAVGIDCDGEKHILGIWLARTPAGDTAAGEGARFWASVMADLKNRGVKDILIACGAAGFRPGRQGAQTGVHVPDRRGRPRGPGRVRGIPAGEEVPGRREGLGRRLGRLHPVPGLRPCRPEDAGHHQQHRISELPAAQSEQGAWAFPERRRRGQAPVARHHQHRGQARPRARRPPRRHRQAIRPARQDGRRPESHRLAGRRRRPRRNLPGTPPLMFK